MSRLASIFLLATSAIAAQEPLREQFTVEATTSVRTIAATHNRPATILTHTTRAQSQSSGLEEFRCGREERRSAGSASAEVAEQREPKGVTFDLNAAVNASGGHEVQCLGPIILGSQDTRGEAEAVVLGNALFTFSESARPLRYRLQIENALTQAGATVRLTVLENGKSVYDGSPAMDPIDVVSASGKRVAVRIEARGHASDQGGCCDVTQSLYGRVAVRLERAPILAENFENLSVLDSSGKTRRIAGGEDTDGFPEVGAILQSGELNCTATLIAPETAITAAHCVYSREPEQLTFVLGSSVYTPEKTVQVTGYAIPSEANFAYDDETLADDVALIYLSEPQELYLPLYHDRPNLAAFHSAQRPVNYVGFGFALARSHKVDPGKKRQVAIPIHSIRDRTFIYRSKTRNTCSGDSGGPGFVTDGDDLFLLGITSSGDARCQEYGESYRVDAFRTWLESRIR